MYCTICGDCVAVKDMRSHLIGHNPNAENLDPDEVRDCFTLKR